MYWVVSMIVFVVLCFAGTANGRDGLSRAEGGSMTMELDYGIVLNEESSLTRQWITIHSDKLPVDFTESAGLHAKYSDDGYHYVGDYVLEVQKPITALEVRFLTFNIWGEHVRTLAATDVIDLGDGKKKTFDARWDERSEHRISEYYASIAYVAQVRTEKGAVLEANHKRVLEQAKKFAEGISKSDIEPKPDKK